MPAPRPSDRSPSAPGRAGQRFGHIISRPPAGADTQPGSHLVRDDETGITYAFSYADIVTEGLRTIRAGERVRFLTDHARPGHATYVIRLDLPGITELYT